MLVWPSFKAWWMRIRRKKSPLSVTRIWILPSKKSENSFRQLFSKLGGQTYSILSIQLLLVQHCLPPQMRHFVKWPSRLLNLYRLFCKAWDPSGCYKIPTKFQPHLRRLKVEEYRQHKRQVRILVRVNVLFAEKWGTVQAFIEIRRYNNHGHQERCFKGGIRTWGHGRSETEYYDGWE